MWKLLGRNVAMLVGAAVLLPLWSIGGCAGDEDTGGAAVPTECKVCAPGSRTCLGNVSVLCADDGKASTPEPCLGGQTCDPTTGTCKASNCPSTYARECADGKLSVCKGADMIAEDCPADTVCASGACVPATCADGDTACGQGVVLSCAGGAWSATTTCTAEQRCGTKDDAAACVARKCEAGTPICVDANGDGTFETSTTCATDGGGPVSDGSIDCAAKGGTCNGGYCACTATPVGGGDAVGADAVGADTSEPEGDATDAAITPDIVIPQQDVPQLEKPDKAAATIGGELIDFDSSGLANWIALAGDEGPSEFGVLQIILAAGVRRIEIQVQPTEIGWTGSINSDAGGDIIGFIGYNDGTRIAVDFTYGAGTSTKVQFPGSWDITIDENGGYDGRVVGKFYGTLTHVSGAGTLEIVEGTFDVHHSN